jgi:hypothetical protein
MKTLLLKPIIPAILAIFLLAGCTATHKTMREPNIRLELDIDDFTLSEQVSAEASSTKIIGIDWKRLLNTETAAVQGAESLLIDLASIPIMGTYIYDQTANYALYQLMMNNPDYDVVIYPQYHTVINKPILGIGFILKKTNVKATARLGKLKSE